MIVKENVTIYVCDHCKKKLYVRQAMERHEKWCTKNPENYKACGGCVYLEDIKVPYDVYDELGEISAQKEANGFRCKKLDKILYPLKVEVKGLVKKYPETFKAQHPMPKECEHSTPMY